MEGKKTSGKIYLVGAGPGDPELITVKAHRLLKECDVIIYDALVNTSILNDVPSNVEKIFIGASRHKGRIEQKEVVSLMIKKASQVQCVIRFKGGDPFMFGRGGEEAIAISESGIEWEIIPGISSGIAVPACAGIPLTHRDCASSVTFITGHECLNNSRIEWEKIRNNYNTLVIFMGAGRIRKIVCSLLKSNYKPTMPLAIIESGTTEKERVRTATLGDVSEKIDADPIQTPALIVIGEVVKFRDKLANLNYSSEKLNHKKQIPNEK